jgi:hypothetical protein
MEHFSKDALRQQGSVMSLHRLPLELLKLIIELTIPEGFESFALACKPIYNASAEYIPRHNAMKRYSYIELPDHDEDSTLDAIVGSPIELILEIMRNPVVARYIEYLDLRNEQIFSSEEIVKLDGELRCAFESINSLQSPLLRTLYLQDHDEEPGSWAEALNRELRMPHANPFSIVFLLTMLPNVKALALPYRWHRLTLPSLSRDLSAVLNATIHTASRVSKSMASLSRLTSLYVTFETDPNAPQSFSQAIGPFLELTSLRVLQAAGCSAIDRRFWERNLSRAAIHKEHGTLGEGLQVIDIAGCYMGNLDLSYLLSCASRLRVFRLCHAASVHEPSQEWDAREFTEILQSKVGETLEVLSLSKLWDAEPMRGRVESMRGFKKLKSLELDARILMPARCSSPPDSGTLNDGIEIPHLVRMLPPSIQEFRVLVVRRGACINLLERFFAGSDTRTREQLPDLAKVAVEYSSRIWSDDLSGFIDGETVTRFAKSLEKANIEVTERLAVKADFMRRSLGADAVRR